MAKKKTGAKQKPDGRGKWPRPPRPNMRSFLTRQPEDVLRWLEDTAAENQMARDQFVRVLLIQAMKSYKAMKKPGTTEARLFADARDDLAAITERVMREVLAEKLPESAVRRMLKGGE